MSFLFLLFIHIKFRIRQIIRMLTFNSKLVISSFIFIMLIMAVKLPDNYFPILFLFPVIIFHLGRKDIYFLKKTFHRSWRFTILLENLIIWAFLSAINIHYRYDVKSIACVFIILILSFFVKSIEKKKTLLKWNFLPYPLFEWRSYLRKNTILIILFYPLILTSAYESSTLIFGGLFILDPVSHVFKHNECKEMLDMYFSRISLKEKVKQNIIFFNIALTPLYILFVILNLTSFYIVIYYIAFMNLYYLLVVTEKYKLYAHDKPHTEYYMGNYFEKLFLAITIVPALFSIKKNIELSNQKIKSYVGNPKY